MYGMIHKAMRDMVKSDSSEITWDKIQEVTGVGEEDFLSLRSYDDEVCYRLLDGISQVLNLSPDECLTRFGRYWIMVTAANNYDTILRAHGRNTIELLDNLNHMHNVMRSSFSAYSPPDFKVEHLGTGECLLHYFSSRQGLTPFLKGLLTGLGEFYDENIQILSITERKVESGEHSEFHLLVDIAA